MCVCVSHSNLHTISFTNSGHPFPFSAYFFFKYYNCILFSFFSNQKKVILVCYSLSSRFWRHHCNICLGNVRMDWVYMCAYYIVAYQRTPRIPSNLPKCMYVDFGCQRDVHWICVALARHIQNFQISSKRSTHNNNKTENACRTIEKNTVNSFLNSFVYRSSVELRQISIEYQTSDPKIVR